MVTYRGFTGDVVGVIANPNNSNAMSSITNQPLVNTNSPLADAQRQANIRAHIQQKRPVVFEYPSLASNKSFSWKSIQMYINPENISLSTQKIKAKTITRGGIFYHHYGDDHYAMTISGTTGLSGMKGIEQLEEIYHASGTLLQYTKFGPEKIALKNIQKFQVIDFNDPQGVLSTLKSGVDAGPIRVNYLKQQMSSQATKYNTTKLPVWNGVPMTIGQKGKLNILKDIQYYDKNTGKQKGTYKKGNGLKVYVTKTVYNSKLRTNVWELPNNIVVKNIKGYVQFYLAPKNLTDQLAQYAKDQQNKKSLSSDLTKKSTTDVLQKIADMYVTGMYNIEMADNISSAATKLFQFYEDQKTKNKKAPSDTVFNQQASQLFKAACPGFSSDLIGNLAYEFTKAQYGNVSNDIQGFTPVLSTNVNITDNPYRVDNIDNTNVDSDYLNIGNDGEIAGTYLSPDTKLVQNQIGMLMILKPIWLFKGRQGTTVLTPSRQAQSGEQLKVFGTRSDHGGQYIVEDGYTYITNMSGYVKYLPVEQASSFQPISEDDIGVKTSLMSLQRSDAILKQVRALEDFYVNEKNLDTQLRAKAGDFLDEKNPWLPRSIIMYFENRAYVGHFDSFNYNRVADSPLIRYDLRFTITKQIVGSI